MRTSHVHVKCLENITDQGVSFTQAVTEVFVETSYDNVSKAVMNFTTTIRLSDCIRSMDEAEEIILRYLVDTTHDEVAPTMQEDLARFMTRIGKLMDKSAFPHGNKLLSTMDYCDRIDSLTINLRSVENSDSIERYAAHLAIYAFQIWSRFWRG